jgi:hypothetical protein
MRKHFILNLNPNAQFEWERCTLHNPITAGQPNLAQLVAQLVAQLAAPAIAPDEHPGTYLVAVNIEVEVLETAAIEQTCNRLIGKLELPALVNPAPLSEIAA